MHCEKQQRVDCAVECAQNDLFVWELCCLLYEDCIVCMMVVLKRLKVLAYSAAV